MGSVFLVGFMGSGKSTVGPRLAAELGLPFADLDDDIEARDGRTIAEIFSADGEAAFRDLEYAALRARVVRGEPVVLALGGGAFTFARNRELLPGAGKSVWLDCPFEVAHRRVEGFAHRPLARDPAQFRALFEKRRADYALADIQVASGGDEPSGIVRAILEALR